MPDYLYIANKSITLERQDGEKVKVKEGQTLLAHDDELVRFYPDFFTRTDLTRSDVEEATSEPGRKRNR